MMTFRIYSFTHDMSCNVHKLFVLFCIWSRYGSNLNKLIKMMTNGIETQSNCLLSLS